MKKFFWFPLWKVEKAEAWLSEMEREGWRLVKVGAFHRFHFKKSVSKEKSYFFTWSMIKGRGMWDTENYLKGKCNADAIPSSGWCSLLYMEEVFRMTHMEEPEKLYFYRALYLRHLLWQRILMYMLVPVFTALCLLMEIICYGFPYEELHRWLGIGLLSVPCLVLAGWNVYGLQVVKRRYHELLGKISLHGNDLKC